MHWFAIMLLLSLLWTVGGNVLNWPWWWLLLGPVFGFVGFAVCQSIDDRSRA